MTSQSFTWSTPDAPPAISGETSSAHLSSAATYFGAKISTRLSGIVPDPVGVPR